MVVCRKGEEGEITGREHQGEAGSPPGRSWHPCQGNVSRDGLDKLQEAGATEINN